MGLFQLACCFLCQLRASFREPRGLEFGWERVGLVGGGLGLVCETRVEFGCGCLDAQDWYWGVGGLVPRLMECCVSVAIVCPGPNILKRAWPLLRVVLTPLAR